MFYVMREREEAFQVSLTQLSRVSVRQPNAN